MAIVFPATIADLLVGAMAALAEAAADTVSSEVGQAVARQPRMILGFTPAPVGTNGAVTVEGTLAGWSRRERRDLGGHASRGWFPGQPLQ